MKKINNIDTFIFLVNIESYQEKTKKVLSFLKEEKEKAKIYFQNTKNDTYLISINNLQFTISRTGTKGYSYILNNENFNICIAEFISGIRNYKPIKIKISSQALWNIGLLNAYKIIIDWTKNTFGKITEENVYRIDLACHCNNDFITNYETSYKGHFKKSEIKQTGNIVNALCFGSRKNDLIYCRIYNKTLELKEKKTKTWFKDIWQKSNLDINNVWNLEFEIKSEFLRSKNLKTFIEVYEHIQDLWNYCTNEWLLKVIPNKTRISRCDISSDWLEIQTAFNNFNSSGFVDIETIKECDAKILVPTITGYLTSYSANKNITNLQTALSSLEIDSKKYFKNKNTTFEDEVTSKIQLKGAYTNEKTINC